MLKNIMVIEEEAERVAGRKAQIKAQNGKNWRRLFRLISVKFAYFAYFRLAAAGAFWNLKCAGEDSKAGFRALKQVRWSAFARLSPAKSAFARLLVGKIYF
jgi:hypothetical protein